MKSKLLTICLLYLLTSQLVSAQYLIKFSPSQVLLSNELGIAFEHRIRSKISIEGQAGTTFSKDLTKIETILENRFNRSSNLENGWGFFGALSLRYYILGYNVAPAGFYVGTFYKYRLFNATVTHPLTSSTDDARNNQFILQAICGYQFPFTKLFSMDFYVGLGVNFQNEYLPVLNYNQFNTEWEIHHIKRVTFAPTLGVKLGFGKSGRELL